jgi:DNA-binding beta-propeller fold protein YncE
MSLCVTASASLAQLKEVSGFQNPESVIGHKDYLYVSNLGAQLDPTAKDGDGFISQLSRKDGKMVEEKFITGLNSPKGMVVRHGLLVVADADKVVVFHIKSKKKVWEADLATQGITYANDLVKVCGGVLVSTTDKNAIYKVCKSGKIKQVAVKGDLPGANGLTRKCGKLYVANYGRGDIPNGSFGKITSCSKKYTEYMSGGAYDGIVKVCGRLVVTDWVSSSEDKGRIVIYDTCKKTSSTLDIGRTINEPADIYADGCNKTLWVPAMRENKILGIPFSLIKKK